MKEFEMRNVLLTGAKGYVGRRLMGILAVESEVNLRLFVRNKLKLMAVPLSRRLGDAGHDHAAVVPDADPTDRDRRCL
jgi:thioester reductase-like protein